MKIPIKLGTKKGYQLCIKLILFIVVIAIYFIVLLRESFAAWESTKTKRGNNNSRNNNNAKISTTRVFYIRNHPNRNMVANTHKPNITLSPSNFVQRLTTVNPIYEYSEEMNAATESDFRRRQNRLSEVCAQHNNFSRLIHPNAKEFLISPGHGIAWCNIFKAGSSIWMYYFNILGGYDIKYLEHTKTSPLELARKRFPRPTLTELQEVLPNSLSFLIVREPFQRLLSAYRNKLQGSRNKYYKVLGDEIIKKYRKETKRKLPGPTFKEFLTFIIDNYKNNGTLDEHWAPIYTFCTPCSINYTLIAKLETFQRDTEYIIRQAGLETLLLNKVPSKKMRLILNYSSSQTAKLITKYYSEIDGSLLNELLNIYALDFDLFGYNRKIYYDLIRSNKTTNTTVECTTRDPKKSSPKV